MALTVRHLPSGMDPAGLGQQRPQKLVVTHTQHDEDRRNMGTALLIVASNRPQYLRRSLAAVARHIPPPNEAWPVIISEDGIEPPVATEVEEFKGVMKGRYISHIHYADRRKEGSNDDGYFRLARHYKWALDQVCSRYSTHNMQDNTN